MTAEDDYRSWCLKKYKKEPCPRADTAYISGDCPDPNCPLASNYHCLFAGRFKSKIGTWEEHEEEDRGDFQGFIFWDR